MTDDPIAEAKQVLSSPREMLYTKECLVDVIRRLVEVYHEHVDALLNHCEDPECGECGVIICPHRDSFHFHHDGCPACAENEDMRRGYDRAKARRGTDTLSITAPPEVVRYDVYRNGMLAYSTMHDPYDEVSISYSKVPQ
jgi:hypothetical protein